MDNNKFRPTTLDDFCGQSHLIGDDGAIKLLLDNNKMCSAIFFGPSGSGKTTLANIICKSLKINFGLFNAAINNKKDLLDLIEQAKFYENFLIIVDEIHRLNKDKQDILLPYLETANIIVIGLTTANPLHSINPAIRSRMHIFEFYQLSSEEINEHLQKVCKTHYPDYEFDNEIFDMIVSSSNGDLRYALNQIEVLTIISENNRVDLELLKKLNPKKSLLIDKNSDYYYDLLSAFQKSIRGSDVDASLHYLAQLINLGDIDIICRRMIITSYEDIGLANPSLHARILSAIEAAQMVGFPEAKIPLSHAIIELALSPKSNTAYTAVAHALEDTKKNFNLDVPDNIKHHKVNYLYPHEYGGWVKQQYLPDVLEGRQYVKFKNNKYEQQLKKFYDIINKQK